MRIHTYAVVIFLLSILSLSSFARTNKEMDTLFEKYDEVMSQHKVELVDEVFTEAFLQGHGGKEEFIAKVKTLPIEKKKKGLGLIVQKWKTSKVGKFFSAKVKGNAQSTEFIIKEENGKLKIDGTLSDG